MNRTFIVLLGLGLLATFGYYCVYVHSTASIIQNDIDTRVKSSIEQVEELAGITINTDGRDITLSGEVFSEDLKRLAAINISKIDGVRKITNLLSVAHTGPEAETIQPNTEPEPVVEPDIEPVIEEATETVTEPIAAAPAKEEIHAPIVAELPVYSCQQELNFLLENRQIQFATNSAEIDASSYDLLDSLINVATSQCVEAEFEIAGYTDSQGDEDFNLKLSQQRASSVMEYFIQNGLQSERLTAVGYGESTPIADNDTAEGKIKNRRIELKVKLEEIQ